jgi:hypothetical protein
MLVEKLVFPWSKLGEASLIDLFFLKLMNNSSGEDGLFSSEISLKSFK